MKANLLLLALIALVGCDNVNTPENTTATVPVSNLPQVTHSSAIIDKIVNRAWKLSATATELAQPGRIRIFLENGVLLQGSCWEPFRLSNWKPTGPDSFAWNEDGIEITATVALADPAAILTMQLPNEARSERLVPMDAPFVCPDYPK